MARATSIGRPNILEFGGGNAVPDAYGYDALRGMARDARRTRRHLVANDNKPTSAHAVYVVSDSVGLICKIGKAHCPSRRLSTIQTGNPTELFLHRVFWFDDERSATEIERRSHEYANRVGRRLMGEWFECPVNHAHEIVVRAADEMNIDYAVFTPETGKAS